MLHLLDLPDDVLFSILSAVMSPASEGARQILTADSLRASLPLAKTCTRLYNLWRGAMHDLELWVAASIDDRGLRSICRANGRAVHRLGLRRCQQLSLRALNSIPMFCTRLRSLDVSHTHVTDFFIANLVDATGKTLQFLALNGCDQLSAGALRYIADNCPNLRFLDIGGVSVVDDDVVAHIAHRLGASLRTLILSRCVAVSDLGLAAIGTHCSALMSLTVRGLPEVTDAGLLKLCEGIGEQVQILDVVDCTGLTMGGYFATMERCCPHVFRYLEESNYVEHLGERCLRDNIIATMPGLIYRISATDAIRRLPALYFLLLDESALRPFRVSVQSKSLNLSDFGSVLISNFGKKPTPKTRSVLLNRFGYDSPFDSGSDDDSCDQPM